MWREENFVPSVRVYGGVMGVLLGWSTKGLAGVHAFDFVTPQLDVPIIRFPRLSI